MENGPTKKFAAINITPMVDVMLVLLVIFMITAPLMFNGIKLQLPKTKEVNAINITSKTIVLSISKDEKYYLGQDLISVKNLERELKNKIRFKQDVLYLRADFDLSYGKVAGFMSKLKKMGIEKIALVTEIKK